MSTEKSTRVLVLEEDPAWRSALASLYSAILGPRTEVETATDAAIAERLLRNRPADIFSLNLNLSEDRPRGIDGPLLCDTARLHLVEMAAKKRWAAAVVLVTRADAPDEGRSRFVACDRAKLDEATVSPDEFVRRRFGDRGLVLNRPARWDLPTTITHFEALIRRRLPALARPGYTLRFGGTAYDPRVTIEAGRQTVTALEGADAMFLSLLVIAGRAGELLGDRSVVEVYRGRDATAAGESDARAVTRLAQREVDGFRRRLRGRGVNDRALIARVRKSAKGVGGTTGAWRLDGSVTSEGMSTLNVRARGGSGFRPDVPTRDE